MHRRLNSVAVAILCLAALGAKCPECGTEVQGRSLHHAKHYTHAVKAQIANVCRVTIVKSGQSHNFSGVYLGEGYVLTCAHPFEQTRSGQVGASFSTGHKSWGKAIHIDVNTDQTLIKLTTAPPTLKGVTLTATEPKVGDHLYAAGYDTDHGKFRVSGGTVYHYERISNAGHVKPSVEFVGHGRNGDSGCPTFNSKGELVGVLWGTSYNSNVRKNLIATVDWQSTKSFFHTRCGIWGRRYWGRCSGSVPVMTPRTQIPAPPPYRSDPPVSRAPVTDDSEEVKPGPIPIPNDTVEEDPNEQTPLPRSGQPQITINNLEVNLEVNAEFYNKLAAALINNSNGTPQEPEDKDPPDDDPVPPDPRVPDSDQAGPLDPEVEDPVVEDPEDDTIPSRDKLLCELLERRVARLEQLAENYEGGTGADPRVTTLIAAVAKMELTLNAMSGRSEKDPRVDQLVQDMAALKALLEGLKPGSGKDSRVDGILAEMGEIKRRMTAIEIKPMRDLRVDGILNTLDDMAEAIAALEAKPCEDPRFDQLAGRLDAIDARLAGLEGDENVQKLLQELRILEKRLVDLQSKVDNLQDRPAQPGQTNKLQVIYLTSSKSELCKRTDEKVAWMREQGYDYIRVVVLSPDEVSVSDVPRLVIFPGKEVVRGEQNVLVYLSQLVR